MSLHRATLTIMTPSSADIATKGPRVAGLDALRGLAILLVLLRHAWPDIFGGAGIVGVVIFFALSGYLITGLLMRDMKRYGRIRYGRFYRNRALRLLPALVLFVIVLSIITLTLNPLDDKGELLRTVIVSLTYTANLPFDHGSNSISHLWTLATEEQFYLIWPVVIALGFRLDRLRMAVALPGILLVLLCGLSVLVAGDGVAALYSLPTSWAVAMVIGGAAQLGKDRVTAVLSRPFLASIALLMSALVLITLSLTPALKEQPWAYLTGGILIGSATVILISLAERRQMASTLFRPLMWLGTISYATYLWNWPISLWLEQSLPIQTAGPLSAILAVAAASLSWLAVERPISSLRTRLDSNARSSLTTRGLRA